MDPSRPHILVLPSWYPDKENPVRGSFFQEHAVSLFQAGYKVGVLNVRLVDDEGGVDQFSDMGVETTVARVKKCRFTVPLEKMKRISFHLNNMFWKYVSKMGLPDLIHVQSSIWSAPAAAYFSETAGVPFVISEHSSAFLRGLLDPLNKPLLKRAFQKAAGISVVSPALAEGISHELGVPRDRLEWIGNMVGERFVPGEKERRGVFRFLSVGGLRDVKGHEDLLYGFASAFKGEAVELVIVGDGPLRRTLGDLCEQLGIAQQIRFEGMLGRAEVVSQMQQCDALVLSSLNETFAVVLIEAMACGQPCVATRCGGPQNILDDHSGLLVEPGNWGELCEAMKKMRSEHANFDGDLIRQRCLDRFGRGPVMERFAEFYRKALFLA